MPNIYIVSIVLGILIIGSGLLFTQSPASIAPETPAATETTAPPREPEPAPEPAKVISEIPTPPPAAPKKTSTTAAPKPAPAPVVTSTPTPTPAPTPAAPTKVSVDIQNFAYNPLVITIKKGTTVTWTNKDTNLHTVTGDGRSFASETMKQGDTFSYTFNTVGQFPYTCAYHTNMAGTVKVTE